MMKIKKENEQKVGSLTQSPYNPRKITDKQLSMLKKSMLEFGDLSGIVKNIRTGHLVGGHQRIKNLDPSWPIVSEPHSDKTGTVALGYIETPSGRWQYREVDWPEKEEAAANIAANQHGGEFDLPKLREIIIELDDGAFDTELFGFNSHELELMMTATFQGDEPKKEKLTPSDVAEDNPKLAKFIEQREKSRARGKDKNELNFWVCLIFQSYDQKIEFLNSLPDLQVKYGMYVDGEVFAEAMGIRITPNTQKPFQSPLDKNLIERVME